MSSTVRSAIALGSNVGDRRAHLDYAISRLRSILSDLVVSSYLETVPVDVPVASDLFLNAAAVGETELSARALLETLLEIEHDRGRERPFANAPRTLDLDLILYGNAVIDEPGLLVPHPRFRERRFVLEPLAEIAAGWRDPVTEKSVAELMESLNAERSTGFVEERPSRRESP